MKPIKKLARILGTTSMACFLAGSLAESASAMGKAVPAPAPSAPSSSTSTSSQPPAPVPTSVDKNGRALMLVVNLSKNVAPKDRWLYQFLDASSISLTQVGLGPKYRSMHLLAGSNATSGNFVSNVSSLAKKPENQALDVFLHLHGSPGTLYFYDGGKFSSSIKAELQPQNLSSKLRWLHSTACYGSTHAQDFVDLGFRTATGSIAVNADSAYAYPIVLSLYGNNTTVSDTINQANNPNMLAIQDAAARMKGFSDVNSKKLVKGQSDTRISSLTK